MHQQSCANCGVDAGSRIVEGGGTARTWGGPPLGFHQQHISGSTSSATISERGPSLGHDIAQPSTDEGQLLLLHVYF